MLLSALSPAMSAVHKRERAPIPLKHHNLAEFSVDEQLGNGLDLLVQLKGFNRGERIARANKQSRSGVQGSREHRPVSPGAVMLVRDIKSGLFLDEQAASAIFRINDSRGMVLDREGHAYVGSVNEILRIDLQGERLERTGFTDDWLAFIHSMDLSPGGDRLLVTSSGFDRIIEFDVGTGRKIREWVAWDNGYDIAARSGRQIVTDARQYTNPESQILADSPEKFDSRLGLPPAERTAFPNSAIYVDDDMVLATFFHHGLVLIDLTSGDNEVVLDGLSHPHSVLRFRDGYIVTDTGHGSALVLSEGLRVTEEIDFTRLAGLDPRADGRNWLQHVRPATETLLLGVDSNRATIFLFDLESRKVRRVPTDNEWVMQEVAVF